MPPVARVITLFDNQKKCGMDKEYIQKVVAEFPEDVKQVMTVASVVCLSLIHISEPTRPY